MFEEHTRLVVRRIYHGKKALIFDDVYTTGSTVEECAKAIQELGCKEISVMTIAKD